MEKDKKVDEIMDTISSLLINYVKKVFSEIMKKSLTNKEAKTLLSNIGLHIMNKNKDIILK